MVPTIKGRGAAHNPANRFERLHVDLSENDGGGGGDAPATEFYRDATRTILARNDSPDLPFRFSVNPYRGCEHGCVYCYARPSHEYLGFSAGLDFESRIMVKTDAPALLRAALQAPRWQPQVVMLSGNTDCYQPCERELRLTRGCLEVFAEFGNPVGIVTKSALVCRDVDVLRELATAGAVQVYVSITTFDGELARAMEPRAATPERRLAAIAELSAAGIPVGVMAAPIIPGLNDHEIPTILARAAGAGARAAGWTLLRLASPLDGLFGDWLSRHFPDRRHRVLHRLRECRDGAVNDSRFGHRMRGQGVYAAQIADLFRAAARRHGLDRQLPPPATTAFRRPPRRGEQLDLFG